MSRVLFTLYVTRLYFSEEIIFINRCRNFSNMKNSPKAEFLGCFYFKVQHGKILKIYLAFWIFIDIIYWYYLSSILSNFKLKLSQSFWENVGHRDIDKHFLIHNYYFHDYNNFLSNSYIICLIRSLSDMKWEAKESKTHEEIVTKIGIMLGYFNLETSLQLRWSHARDFDGSKIPVTTGEFELRTSNVTCKAVT